MNLKNNSEVYKANVQSGACEGGSGKVSKSENERKKV